MKFRSGSFYGNQYTGTQKAAKNISNTLKWLGRGLAVKSALDIEQQYKNGEIIKTERG